MLLKEVCLGKLTFSPFLSNGQQITQFKLVDVNFSMDDFITVFSLLHGDPVEGLGLKTVSCR